MAHTTCFSDEALAWLDDAKKATGEMHDAGVKFRWYVQRKLEPHGPLAGSCTKIQGRLIEYRAGNYRMFFGFAREGRIAVSGFVEKRTGRLRQRVYDQHEERLERLMREIEEGARRC